ncbi:SMI1/KNR4 family protein [Paenibacillus sp. FSL M7-1046]|uniref:SMI1/KNR4 family protein n=1 Tax=Paenibacillus sp. FSL M7-1046 TaxID=2975315 RepID=UPI0030F7C82A
MPQISRIHDKISMVQVENFEQMNKIELPKLYKEFLLEYNGGRVDPNVFKISSDEGESALNVFYGIGSMNNNLEKKIEFFEEILEIGFIPIARDSGGNQICLGIREEFYDQIFFWIHDEENDHSMDNMHYLADNIQEFIETLYDTE